MCVCVCLCLFPCLCGVVSVIYFFVFGAPLSVLPSLAQHHVRLYVLRMRVNIFEDVVFDDPPEEVELSDGGLDVFVFGVVIIDAIPAPERIKVLLRVRFQLSSVAQIHVEKGGRGVRTVFLEGNDDVFLLGIVGHEPVKEAERHI